MELIRIKQSLHAVAIRSLKQYGLPAHDLQAFGLVHRAEDKAEFPPDYIALATKRWLIILELKGWSNDVLQPFREEKFALDNLRLTKVKKGFLYYYLALDANGTSMHLSVPRRFAWHNYEKLAEYLIGRVRNAGD